jgi:hypothetical protein
MQYDNNLRGALFKNTDKEEDTHPDYKGHCEIGGVKHWISAWIKTSKAGSKYMSLAFKVDEKSARQNSQRPQENNRNESRDDRRSGGDGRSSGGRRDFDDDTIPFAQSSGDGHAVDAGVDLMAATNEVIQCSRSSSADWSKRR